LIGGKNNPGKSIMEEENKLDKHRQWNTEPVLDCFEEQHEDPSEMEDEKVYDLVDVIEEGTGRDESLTHDLLEEAIRRNVSEIAEKVAREMFPQIAERLIREEIEKLKEKAKE
jgi:hypothetical protein